MSKSAAIQLTDGQLKALTYIEQCFWEHGNIPTNERIVEVTGISEQSIQKYWKVADFRKALGIRGVDFNPERSKGILTSNQLVLANMLMNTTDQRSIREKLKEINISTQQYNAWLRQAAFRDHLAKRGEELFKGTDHVAYKSLAGAVGAGDVSALKLFFEMRGIYNPKVDVNINVDMLLVKVVEVIAKHVKDPVLLAGIADDLDGLTGGLGGGGSATLPGGVQRAIPIETLGIGGSGLDDEGEPVHVSNYDDIEILEEVQPSSKTSVAFKSPPVEEKSFEDGGSLLSF